MFTVVKCRAKNPKKCRYHGIGDFSDQDRAAQEVLEALDATRIFLINRKQRKSLLKTSYSKDDFLEPKDYNTYITHQQRFRDPTAIKFFEAESEWQDNWLKANHTEQRYKELKMSIYRMTRDEELNIKLRTHQPLDERDITQLRNIEEMYNTIPERGLNNRLFRGLSFDNERRFKEWLKSRMASPKHVKMDEYIRVSAYANTAFSFATKRPYSVIFEYITPSGIYTNKFSPAPQEAEVILDREKRFLLKGTYMTEVYDHDIALKREIRVVRLLEV